MCTIAILIKDNNKNTKSSNNHTRNNTINNNKNNNNDYKMDKDFLMGQPFSQSILNNQEGKYVILVIIITANINTLWCVACRPSSHKQMYTV